MIYLDNDTYFEYAIIGEFHAESMWQHPARMIATDELIFVLEGTVYIEEDNIQYELHANEMLLLEAGKHHAGYKKSELPTSFYWFHFNTNMPLPFKTYRRNDYYEIKNLLKKLLHVSNTPYIIKELADTVGLHIFLALSQVCQLSENSNNAFAKKIAEYIRMNACNGLTVEELSVCFGYNADYLGKLFKKVFKIGLKEYIADERMKKAKDMLLTTNLSVKEISARLCFANENLFIKFFKYHEDISPAKYKNQYCNTHMNNQ